MRRLTKASDIVVLRPTPDELVKGAEYAALTLPWTFNRMMMNTGATGQCGRGLNIAKGIVGQEMLRRALGEIGLDAKAEKKSHRDDDLFDFQVQMANRRVHFDVKTIHHYTDYGTDGIKAFAADMIIENAAYAGGDWRKFFPMLMAHTQIRQEKENYVFAIASSVDPRKDVDNQRTRHALTAYPYGEHLPFLSSKRLCLKREEVGKGFFLKCKYEAAGLLDRDVIELTVVGEWNNRVRKMTVMLGGHKAQTLGPFSCVNCFQVDRKHYENLYGTVLISVSSNDFREPVLNSLKADVNTPPEGALAITQETFCNLLLPSDYTMYCIGWIPKAEFLVACRRYKGWVWPMDSVDKFRNQPWSQITQADVDTVTTAGFGDCIQRKPSRINAGWLKTSGRGPGACCYVFPNTGHNGGLKETNLYVLPQDLYAMSELKNYGK